MKISILSMHRIVNYGSILQAYALKKVLETQGHEVSFIDIEDGEYHEAPEKTRRNIREKISLHKKHILRWIKYRHVERRICQIINRAQNVLLGLKNEKLIVSKECEAVVIGSDEVFNCAPTSSWGISTQMFGNIDVPVVISYAASCGYTKHSDIPEEWQSKLGEALKRMRSISVRDNNTFDFVKKVSGISPEYHIDPVLLYDFEEEIEEAEKNMNTDQPYMIVYAYANRIQDKEEIYAIKHFAKKKGLKTICVGGMLTWCDEYPAWSPFEVLVGFKHAAYIVTDTFHGTVISSKFNKPFAVLVRDSNVNKLNDILDRFGLMKHRVDEIAHLDKILTMSLNYNEFNQKIHSEKEQSLKYFIKNL